MPPVVISANLFSSTCSATSGTSFVAQMSTRRLLEAARRHELPGRMFADDWRFSRAALLSWLGRAQDDREADA